MKHKFSIRLLKMETNREFMMILEQKKVKLPNEDAVTRRNPYSNSEIYITTVKVAQYRQVAANSREKEEGKKVKAKKIATIKIHLQLKRSEDFDR